MSVSKLKSICTNENDERARWNNFQTNKYVHAYAPMGMQWHYYENYINRLSHMCVLSSNSQSLYFYTRLMIWFHSPLLHHIKCALQWIFGLKRVFFKAQWLMLSNAFPFVRLIQLIHEPPTATTTSMAAAAACISSMQKVLQNLSMEPSKKIKAPNTRTHTNE